MTQRKTEALLKKINYIEADMEIHKQILFATPSAQKAEMEKTIALIAAKKEEIELLRHELRKHDPKEYERILVFENASAEFRKIATDTPFQAIINRNVNEECSLALQSGDKIKCLVKACDKDKNWTIITLDGQIKQFPAADVSEKPPAASAN